MKGMMLTNATPRPRNMAPMLAKHERMIRRATNHNVHILTHHGKVMIGRKGRKV